MTFRAYLRGSHPLTVALDLVGALAILAAPLLAVVAFRWVASTDEIFAPIHRRLWASASQRSEALVYGIFLILAFVTNTAWMARAVRNLVAITLARSQRARVADEPAEKLALPPFPYSRESFALVLGEIQARDGGRVPSPRTPQLRPRWLTLPELALYTGIFVTGGIGSGKTSAVAYPALRQLLGFRRTVKVRQQDGSLREEDWKFSGLILDEKGDFTRAAADSCADWGRADDLVRISPGGRWIWNVIYNPNLPTWAVAYQLGWIIRNFNKGANASDPFWENAPRELVTEYLGLLDDAEGYYTLHDYLETLVDDGRQDALHGKAMERHGRDPAKRKEIERRWKFIMRRRSDMGVNLRGSLEACARAGIDMFRHPELRKTFCPTREEYFELDPASGNLRPRANVFCGFDQVLDYGRVVGLEMPKQIFFDAAVFVQVALKAQWQDAVLRREAVGPDGKPVMPPRFGEKIGYCPTFLMADEAQLSATPRDGDFKAVCRSKRASMWELTQSHASIKGAFGPNKQADAATYFQNSMTHIYLRQSDLDSMKLIQEECGKKVVQKTTLAVTEGGTASELSYFEGSIVHEGMGMSSTKTVSTEEKPFVEIEDLKRLPNNVALVLPSNGDRTLAATVTYLRPLWIFRKYPDLAITTSWLDWPHELRATHDLDDVPQEIRWKGWGISGALDERETVPAEARLGRLVQRAPPTPPDMTPAQHPPREIFDLQDDVEDDEK